MLSNVYVYVDPPSYSRSNCPWGQKAFTGYLGEDKAAWAEYDACDLATKYVQMHQLSFGHQLQSHQCTSAVNLPPPPPPHTHTHIHTCTHTLCARLPPFL